MMQPNPSPRRKFNIKRVAILLGILTALGVVIFGIHHFQVRRQAGVLLTRASNAAEEKDWALAVGLYQAYLNFRPDDVDAVVKYADVLEAWSKTNRGVVYDLIKVYERLLVLDPNRSEQRRKLVGHYIDVAYYSGVRVHLNHLMALTKSQDAELFILTANCDEGERKFLEATDNLKKAIAAGENDPLTHLRLALMLRNDIRTPEAEKEADGVMNTLVNNNPNDPRAILARADFRIIAGNNKGAREDVDKAFRLPGGPENPGVVLAMARLATTPEEIAQARAALSKAATVNPTDTRLQVSLAELLIRDNNQEEAKNALIKIAPHASHTDGSLLDITDRLIDLGNYTTPQEQAKRFTADAKLAFLADYVLGRVALAEGNWPEALALLQKSLSAGLRRYSTQFVKAQIALAECHKYANNPDQRMKALNTAILVDAKSLDAQMARADALVRSGQYGLAINAYESLAPKVPLARVELARLRLGEQAAKPEKERDWTIVDEAIGPEPLPIELAIVKANMIMIQGRVADVVSYLEKRIEITKDRPSLWVALALSKSTTDPKQGLNVLNEAEQVLGSNTIELRLAKAELISRNDNPDPSQLMALASNLGAIAKKDRFRLLTALGDTLRTFGHRKAAIELFHRAAAESPFDLNSRAVLFDLALTENDEALQNEMLAELARIDGTDGPTRILAESTKAVLNTKPGDTARIISIRNNLETVRSKRENWGRLYIVLGDVEILDGNRDAATDYYRRAVRLGERGEPLIRALVSLLIERQGHQEALGLLTNLNRSGPLGPELTRQLNVLRGMFGEDADRGLEWAKNAVTSRDPRDHLTRATIYSANNANGEARKALELAVSRGENLPEVWITLVRFLSATGQMRDAAAAVEQASTRLKPIKDTPEDRASVELALGVCREVIDELKKAEEHYRNAVKLLPADPAANRQLALLLQRTGRRTEGDAILDKIVNSNAQPAIRRWARRTLAFSKVNHPDGFAELPAALELIEANLREGKNLLDDQRAKALIIAIDPLKRTDAINMLVESSKTIPLPADQSYLLGRLFLLQNQPEKAEVVLRQATRASGIAPPEYFALLVRAQLALSNTADARQTVARMKEVAPKSWITLSEEARVLSATGQKAAAGKLILDAVGGEDAALLASRAGPLLEEIQCQEDAEKVYKSLAATGSSPTAHVPLASYYLHSNRPTDAMKVAWEGVKKNAAPGLSARLMSASARLKPLPTIPEAERTTWEQQEIKPAEGWVRSQFEKDPKNVDLLISMAEFDDLYERYDEEIKRYEQVLKEVPENEIVLNNLSLMLALHRNDGSERTLEFINKAMAKKGPKPSYLDTRAMVHIVGNRPDQAIQDLNAAMSLDPKPVYYYHLALAYDRQMATKPEARKLRDNALTEAVRRGLTKSMLHPKEWIKYDDLTNANVKKK